MTLIALGTKLYEVVEGKAKILAPDPSAYSREGKYDPSWAPVFYNPKMTFNRDASVIAVSLLSPKSILDSMSATGIRGIRYNLESVSPDETIFNDKNPAAITLLRINVERNGLKNYKITQLDANVAMHQFKVDFTDVDPFGSPSPFTLGAVASTRRGGVIALTATDLAPLEGSSRASCFRKYGVRTSKLSYSKEAGLRILLGKVVRDAALFERGVVPLFSFYKEYYYRLFVKLEPGAKRADKSLQELGTMYECTKCGYIFLDTDPCIRSCPLCGGSLLSSGPAWTGSVNDEIFLDKMRSVLEKFSYLKSYSELSYLLNLLKNENKYKLYYNLSVIASKLRTNMRPIHKVLECLGDASRTHFNNVGIKTSREFKEVVECLKSSY
jgi:tRNA (guanine26-N2/guanine27-N2)-dimethyltransferase